MHGKTSQRGKETTRYKLTNTEQVNTIDQQAYWDKSGHRPKTETWQSKQNMTGIYTLTGAICDRCATK